MSSIANIFWFLFAGLWMALGWIFVCLVWCITIVGIPIDTECFKFASFVAFPFGKTIVYSGGGVSFLMNLLWLIFGGLEMALGNVLNGLALCVTIIGIPLGLQCFKFAKLALMPFGARWCLQDKTPSHADAG